MSEAGKLMRFIPEGPGRLPPWFIGTFEQKLGIKHAEKTRNEQKHPFHTPSTPHPHPYETSLSAQNCSKR